MAVHPLPFLSSFGEITDEVITHARHQEISQIVQSYKECPEQLFKALKQLLNKIIKEESYLPKDEDDYAASDLSIHCIKFCAILTNSYIMMNGSSIEDC